MGAPTWGGPGDWLGLEGRGWPLHDIVITNIVLCMAYTGGGGGGRRTLRNRRAIVAIVRAMQVGGDNRRRIDSCTKASKQNTVL